jgi:putative phosphoesterase
MKIGILSDSHRKSSYQEEAIEKLKEYDISYLIHAGDLCIEENLQSLENSGLPYVSVFGNNDYPLLGLANKYNIRKEPYYFKIKDTTFKLMHLPFYMVGDSDIVISGHTHQFEQEFINNTLFINPGEVCAREKPLIECVVLEIKENKYIITYNFKDLNLNKWETKKFEYEK